VRWLLVLVALGACHDDRAILYPWDERGVVCSQPVDDLTEKVPWHEVEGAMNLAARDDQVVLLHAHTPGATISIAGLEHVLELADHYGLEYLTYRDLAAPDATPRAGIALALDDNGIEEWMGIRQQLAAHGAHVTYFVTRYISRSDEEHADIHVLADDGNDIEPHSVNHYHAPDYAAAHGVDGYMVDEMMPSLDELEADGYPPATAYAYPFGVHTDALDTAILAQVPRVRVSPGSCPY
jgi:Polysaccharide deacetylase